MHACMHAVWYVLDCLWGQWHGRSLMISFFFTSRKLSYVCECHNLQPFRLEGSFCFATAGAMDIFDFLPCFFQKPAAENTFVRMVRYLSEAKGRVLFNTFGREFRNSKMMFLKPFFNFEQGDPRDWIHSQVFIRLRYELPESGDVRECAKKHWRYRTTLLRKNGHRLAKSTEKTTILCFGCNDNCLEGEHWFCSGTLPTGK